MWEADDLKQVIPGLEHASEVFRGAQKVVYHCLIRNQACALKVLIPAQLRGDFDVELARARREVDIMAQCDSPHLVKAGPLPLTHVDIHGHNLVYFTEQWIDGMDLQTRMATDGVLSVSEGTGLIADVARAVQALWQQTKLHRDIKPENILRRRVSGQWVLTDLGAAFDMEDVSLSVAGFLPGTDIYFAPERFEYTNKRTMDFRADLFSLGVVAYEALTGVHPFWRDGMKLPQIMRSIVQAEPVPPGQLRHDLPASLNACIVRLLAKHADDRYGTFPELYRDLQQ